MILKTYACFILNPRTRSDMSHNYLKEGIGNAWAGQVNAKLDLAVSAKDKEFILEENLGPEVPMGSAMSIYKNLRFSVPKAWDRIPLSWTN